MRIALRTSAAVALICCVLSCAAQTTGAGSTGPKSLHADLQSVTARHAMVVSIHHEATDAGVARSV